MDFPSGPSGLQARNSPGALASALICLRNMIKIKIKIITFVSIFDSLGDFALTGATDLHSYYFQLVISFRNSTQDTINIPSITHVPDELALFCQTVHRL